MTHLRGMRRYYHAYLARMYAFSYAASQRRILGIRVSTWSILVLLLFLLATWWRQWPAGVRFLLIGLVIWLAGSFWAARRASYTRFVASESAPEDTGRSSPLGVEEKVRLQATGIFGLSNRQASVLLRPANYWRVPLGDHVVMVEESRGRYLYQFFNADTLRSVKDGWLLFGPEPRKALAIQFVGTWGPAYTKFALYDDGSESALPTEIQTIYLTFESDKDFRAVHLAITADLNQAQVQAATLN